MYQNNNDSEKRECYKDPEKERKLWKTKYKYDMKIYMIGKSKLC